MFLHPAHTTLMLGVSVVILYGIFACGSHPGYPSVTSLFCCAVLQSVSNGLHYQGSMSTDYNEYAQLKNTGSR